jgi:hypothetical protein
MRVIDDELLAEAKHALKNAYYDCMNAMLARFVQAGAGTTLDVYELMEKYGFGDVDPSGFDGLFMYVDWPAPGLFGPNHRGSCGINTVVEGLEIEHAERLYINGKLVFEIVDGEWMCARGDTE